MLYEYDCPQFVDFTSNEAINLSVASPRHEVFLSSSSPAIKKALGISQFKVPYEVKKTFLGSNSCVKKVNFTAATNITDSAKINEKKVLSKRLSRSDGALNIALKQQVLKKKFEYFPKPKRSLSETDLRMKKKVTATTPMCLKRTMQNVRSKKLKSTEEMELEKIAELQKQTRQHLRANEVTMRRQKMKQTGYPQKASVDTQKKEKVPVKNSQRDCKAVVDKLNLYTKNARPQVQRNEVPAKKHSTLFTETVKKIELLKKTACSSSDKFIRDLVTPITSQQIPEAAFERMSMNAAIKQNMIQSTTTHSRSEKGKPFKVEPSDSFQTPRLVRNNKENNPVWRKASSKKN